LSQFEPGDIVGAFTTGGYCAGIVAIDDINAGAQALVAFANDAISETKTGFKYGEIVNFRVFRSSSNEELFADVSYAPQSANAGVFEDHGISIIDNIDFKASSVNESSGYDVQMFIYPNPSSGQVNVELISDLQLDGEVSVSAINGQVVYATSFDNSISGSKLSIDLSGLVRGVYYLRLTSDQFTKTEKIILE
jgi:hypothetical protein